MRILLAEDDPMLGSITAASLKDAAHAVDWVKTGRDILPALNAQAYDLLLLDLGLPALDGIDALQALRKEHSLPVVIITARDALDSRLAGLDSGADDYLIKPFDIPELLARIRAVSRRSAGSSPAETVLTAGSISLDTAAFTAASSDAPEPVQLSAKEFALLHALMQRPGKIFARSELEEKLYGWGEEPESNAVDFLIHALRKKLGKTAVKNVRGAGWVITDAP